MRQIRINQVTDRFYDNLELILQNIIPAFDVESIHNFRLCFKNLRAFKRMLGKHQEGKTKLIVYRKLHKTYNLLGHIRDLDLHQVRIANHTNADYASLPQYLKNLGDEMNCQKQKLTKLLSREIFRKRKMEADSCSSNDFSMVNFQIYVQLKLAAIISIVESNHIGDTSLHTIRKELNDLLYNRKKYEEVNPGVSFAPIFEGKDDEYLLKLLDELGDYHDICTSIKMIKKRQIKDLESDERKMIGIIRKDWLKEKVARKVALVTKLKMDIIFVSTDKEYKIKATKIARV